MKAVLLPITFNLLLIKMVRCSSYIAVEAVELLMCLCFLFLCHVRTFVLFLLCVLLHLVVVIFVLQQGGAAKVDR